MKTIRNKTRAPIRVTFAGGKVLHLGPAKTGQIPDQAVSEASVVALLKADKIEVLDGEGPARGGDAAAGGGAHGASRGHPQHTLVTPKGNRGG